MYTKDELFITVGNQLIEAPGRNENGCKNTILGIVVDVTGTKTYEVKDKLKDLGYKWLPGINTWRVLKPEEEFMDSLKDFLIKTAKEIGVWNKNIYVGGDTADIIRKSYEKSNGGSKNE